MLMFSSLYFILVKSYFKKIPSLDTIAEMVQGLLGF